MDTSDYDVIVVGAGPGGLTTAAYLAHAGRRVLVTDARDQVGGHMSAFTHEGYEFDIGLHYTSAPAAQQVLRPLGVEVSFRPFDPDAMFRMLGPGGQLDIPRGLGAFRTRLHEAFPDEREAVDGFLGTVELLADELIHLADRPHLRELPQLPWRLRGLLRHGASTVGGYLDSLHASPLLKTALVGWTTGSVAVQPSRLSLPVAAVLIRQYLDGLAYPQGGSRAISEGLADVVRRHGGEVLLGTEVDRILVDHDKARGVRLRSSSVESAPEAARQVHAPVVVSAVDINQTYLQLLPPDSVPSRLARRVRTYDLPLPLAVVYVVVDRDLAAEGYPNSSHIVSDATDLDAVFDTLRAGDLPEAGSCGVWIANLADPDNPRLCPPGQTNLQLIGVAPAHHEWWGVALGSGATPRYDARKRQLRDQFVGLAERVIPGLADSIVYEETATPVTEERFMRTVGGTSYGPALTPRQTFTRLGPASPIDGLFHAGAGVRPSHGLVGTLNGGLAAAAAVTGIPVAELRAGGGHPALGRQPA
jgi:phytoene dehydrogenase-like protein